MKKSNETNKFALQMLAAMIAGIIAGLLFMIARETLGADSAVWTSINNLLFQDITVAGGERAVGLFYLGDRKSVV